MRTYDNVTLVPRLVSEVEHRSNCDTSVVLRSDVFGRSRFKLKIPIIASPMPDVCNGELAGTMAVNGAMGIIHRFQSITDQVSEYHIAARIPAGMVEELNIGCAIGVTDDFLDRFTALWNNGCRIFCLDTANGANVQVKSCLDAILEEWRTWADAEYFSPFIIAGNVATKEQFKYLEELGVDAIRVGIAGGSVCETKTETGIYLPTLESVCEVVESNPNRVRPLIIADGGIRIPADMCKALACGADMIMAGRIFAGYIETPGPVQKWKGLLYKSYRGSSSYGVQQEHNGEKPDYNEGDETLVPYIDKSAAKVLKKFQAGLQSSMSYANATDLITYRKNIRIEKL